MQGGFISLQLHKHALTYRTSAAAAPWRLQVTWTKGSVLFASGSPFPAMCYDGCEPLQPAQANNSYIFPAVGHAAVLTQAKAIPNEVC
jgi:malate dehydrogenase (oxaloacetate-decarboxylating)(NADP+)